MSKLPIKKPIHNPIYRGFVYIVGTGFGLGYVPKAPGTFGSLLGIPLGIWLLSLSAINAAFLSLLILVFFVWVSQKVQDHSGRGDPSIVVCDEVIGQAIAILGLRKIMAYDSMTYAGFQIPSPGWILLSFLLFRFFDIIKPFPANAFDRRKDGFGIVADDVVAGLYAAIICWAAGRL